MKKISLQKILRIAAIMIFIIGACVGYDVGDKMLTVDNRIVYMFDVWQAFLVWFGAFACGMLILGIARVIDLLEKKL